MDEKNVFFDNLHKELSDKHHLDEIFPQGYRLINIIRTLALGYKMTRKEVALWAANKYQLSMITKAKVAIPRQTFFQKLLTFVASCPENVYQDIIKKTKYDKNI